MQPSLLDTAAPSLLTAARVLKGCRDAEVAWVEAPPPRGGGCVQLLKSVDPIACTDVLVSAPGFFNPWPCKEE